MNYDCTTTDHCIDDIAVSPEEALEAFRKQFPLIGAYVHPCGKVMTYKLKNPRLTASWLSKAERIIKTLGVPMEAAIQEWSRRGKIFEIQLEIKFNG